MLLKGQKRPSCVFLNKAYPARRRKVKFLKDNLAMMQILGVFSDGKSHNWEAVANKLKLSYNTTLHCFRKLEAQGKLYRPSNNHRYKLGRLLIPEVVQEVFKESAGKSFKR